MAAGVMAGLTAPDAIHSNVAWVIAGAVGLVSAGLWVSLGSRG